MRRAKAVISKAFQLATTRNVGDVVLHGVSRGRSRNSQILHSCSSLGREELEGIECLSIFNCLINLVNYLHACESNPRKCAPTYDTRSSWATSTCLGSRTQSERTAQIWNSEILSNG